MLRIARKRRNKRSSRQPAAGVGFLDTSVFDQALRHRNPRIHRKLAEQLASHYAAEGTSAVERKAIEPYLLRLLSGADREVHRIIADALVKAPFELPADLLFSVIACDNDIALPFLEQVQCLACKRQLAIFKAGDEPRRLALAGRDDACARLVRLIAREGEMSVVRALLDNDSAVLEADDLKHIYVRFREVPAITDRLLARADLPPEVRIAHVRLARSRIEQAMKRGEIPASVALRRNIVETEERALADILGRAAGNAQQLAATIRFMLRRELLTPAVVFRAAFAGHVAVLSEAMAQLAGSSRRRIERAVARGGRLARRFLSRVYQRSGLPEEALPLAMALLEVAAEQEGTASPRAFSREVLLRVMADNAELSVAEKVQLAEMVATFTDGETRDLANRLSTDLRQAA